MKYEIEGNIVDVWQRIIYKGSIEIEDGIIVKVNRKETAHNAYILPGFVDAHVHIESSMLTPERFGQLTIQQGTVAVVTDPHEIANVMGVEGVNFMVENSIGSPIKTYFTIPSCVPATSFDLSGGTLSSTEVELLASSNQFVALSEMMNIPGVLNQDSEVMAKIKIAHQYNLPIDGHAPALTAEALEVYAGNKITTDHECSSLAEALEKIRLGMKILIREGSAARNYSALKSLIKTHPHDVMFCTDDSHPDEIIAHGHINKLVKMAIADGFNLFDVIKIASINPIKHYRLDVGTVDVGEKADFILVDDLESFALKAVYIDGVKQFDRDIPIEHKPEWRAPIHLNRFNHTPINISELRKAVIEKTNTIILTKDELITSLGIYMPEQPTSNLEADLKQDVLKIVYINRYTNGVPQIAYCQGFGLKEGAFASSISHDSHNIIAVGCNDNDLCKAINSVIEHQGALAVCCNDQVNALRLPIGGIMSDEKGEVVAAIYKKLSNQIKLMGCTLKAPFMTLSFMSLIVIPEIKIGEKGLFDYNTFSWLAED